MPCLFYRFLLPPHRHPEHCNIPLGSTQRWGEPAQPCFLASLQSCAFFFGVRWKIPWKNGALSSVGRQKVKGLVPPLSPPRLHFTGRRGVVVVFAAMSPLLKFLQQHDYMRVHMLTSLPPPLLRRPLPLFCLFPYRPEIRPITTSWPAAHSYKQCLRFLLPRFFF